MLTNEEDIDIEETNKQIITAMKEAENKCKQSLGVGKEEKSDSTKKLMKERRNLTDKHQNNSTQLRGINKEISKAIRRDVRRWM